MRDSATPTFYVQSAEDLVLSKLQWFRLGSGVSDRQWNDILAILPSAAIRCGLRLPRPLGARA